MKKINYKSGWTTLEYIIGALIILAAVIIAARSISTLITNKATELNSSIIVN